MSGGGSNCSVACCENYTRKAKKHGTSIVFHRFPSDPHLRKEWIRRCYRKGAFKPQRICSKHFCLSDYEDEIQGHIMGYHPKILKKNAIPTLHLHPTSPPGSPKKSQRAERYKSRQNKFMVEELTTESVEPSNVDDSEAQTNPEGEIGAEENELVDLRNKVEALQQENEDLRKTLAQAEESSRKVDIEEELQNVCKDFLTPNQLALALKRKSKVWWTQEEISRAFTIRYLSKKCYIYLRSTLHYPLPGLTTLHRWAANLNLRGGYLDSIINVMGITKKTKGPLWGKTVLAFDEMKVCSIYEYDQGADEIVGPCRYMQVVMARGLFDNWKQPIYINFDQKLTQEILLELICRLHNVKYDVVAIVSDCGGGNIGLWNELSISIEKTSFKHPITCENIYVFADVPHMLKLLRNWLIDTGFILASGKRISKEVLEQLLKDTCTEISSCYKLTPLHLECTGHQRQNVSLAAQLFSRTTATALQRYLPFDPTVARDVAEFLLLTNNWFDVMNSYTRLPKVPTKLPYGVKLEEQTETITKMMETVKGMRCLGKNTLQVFQKGILISSESLKSLFLELKETLKIEYILTHRLNQDCLENFFSQVRTRGGLNDHPSPLNALYRIRVILLGKNPGIVKAHTNVSFTEGQDGEEDQYLIGKALKQANIVGIEIPAPELPVSISPVGDVAESVSSVSSSTSSSSSSGAANTPIAERDGFNYVAGYLAKKHLKEFPYLGSYTKDMQPVQFHSYALPSWVQSLSFGGFVEPSLKWVAEFELLNKKFEKFHRQTFKVKKNINRETVSYLSKKVSKESIPLPLIKSFVRQRIFIRIKYLNEIRTRGSKRKAPTSDHKVAKKIKKIVT